MKDVSDSSFNTICTYHSLGVQYLRMLNICAENLSYNSFCMRLFQDESLLPEIFCTLYSKRGKAPSMCMEFGRDCCIRGYHVYKEIWQAAIGEELECD